MSDPYQFLRSRGSDLNTQNLNPKFASRLTQALMDAEAATREKAQLKALYRPPELQAQYYADYTQRPVTFNGQTYIPNPGNTGGRAAPPGMSRHEQGAAADINSGPILDYLHQNAGRYGLEFLRGQAFKDDPVHIQLAGGSPSSLPRTGVGGLGAGSGGGGGINVPAGAGDISMPGAASLSQMRQARFTSELGNPETRRLFAASVAAEVGGQGPQAEQAYVESVMNRALARGMSLTQAITSAHSQLYNGERGYYPDTTINKLGRSFSPGEQNRINNMIGYAMQGSNVSNFATGNESGSVHSGGAPVSFNPGTGERFVHENNDTAWINSVRGGGSAIPKLAGATNVADETKQGPGFGPPIPPGTTVQNGQLYRAVPSGTGNYQPGTPGGKAGKGGGMGGTAQSRGQGGLYIPILSDIAGMFAGNYPGRPGAKGGYMQPSATQQQPYAPGANVPVGPQWGTPSGQRPPPPGAPATLPGTNLTPAQAGPTPIKPISVTDYLNPQQSTTPPVTPTPGPGMAPRPLMPMPGSPGVPPYSPPAPSTPVASGATQIAMGPTGKPLQPQLAGKPAISPGDTAADIVRKFGEGIISPANAGELPPGSTAGPQGPRDFSGTGPLMYRPSTLRSGQLLRLENALAQDRVPPAGAGPSAADAVAQANAPMTNVNSAQAPMTNVNSGNPLTSLAGGPAGGTTTIAGIPLPNPRPQMPSGPPVQMGAGNGIPLPRPRPQMPAVPPQQIPQPPIPAQAPPAAPPPPRGNLGGTQMPPGAPPGVRMLDTVPPDYNRPQAASFAERFANAPGQPGVPPIENPGMAAALANLATRPQMTSQGGPVPPAGPEQPPSPAQMNADANARAPVPASFAARFAGAPAVPSQFSALSAFTPGNRGASIVPGQATPANQDDVNAAILDYLRRQQQDQTQTYSGYGDYGSGPYNYASAAG